jgi:hypothetical protein
VIVFQWLDVLLKAGRERERERGGGVCIVFLSLSLFHCEIQEPAQLSSNLRCPIKFLFVGRERERVVAIFS